jgi:hypothetical protein
MDVPIIFISRNRIQPSAAATVQASFGRFASAIREAKPRTVVFGGYLHADELRVVHVFADAAAMAEHFEGSKDRSASAAQLIRPLGFEVYGDAGAAELDQLRAEALEAGGSLAVYPATLGGFLRPVL